MQLEGLLVESTAEPNSRAQQEPAGCLHVLFAVV